MRVEELFKFDGQMGPPSAVPLSDDAVYRESIVAIYNAVYAPALDRFLETRWYTMSGLNAVGRNYHLLAEFAAFIQAASLTPEESPSHTTLAQETRLIWELLKICSENQTSSRDITDSNTKGEALISRVGATSDDFMKPLNNYSATPNSEARHDYSRIQQQTNTHSLPSIDFSTGPPITAFPAEDSTTSILTAQLKALHSLLTNNPLPQTSDRPLIPRSSPVDTPLPSPLAHQLKARRDEFWFSVGRFVDACGDADTNPDLSTAEMKTGLHRARALLDRFENRDVVYTIMRMRFLQRLALRRNDNVTEEAAARLAGWERDGENEEKEKDAEIEVEVAGEWAFYLNILKHEAGLADGGDGVTSGTGKNVVAMRIAAMAIRAFELGSESGDG